MDSHHRGLYVRWLQSPRAELRVGEDLGTSDNVFVIPRDFLQRRSRALRKRLEQRDSKILIPDTTVPTLTEFLIWSHNRKPQLEDRLTFDEVVRLGIFAYKYEIPALSNQVTDRIRENLAASEWELQAGVVDAIYQAAPVNSPLREVVKAALGKLPPSSIDGEEWEKAFSNNTGLAWDCHKAHQAGDKEWARQEYLSGVCRFHNHDGIKRQEGLCDGCPYAEADCYPEWEDDLKQDGGIEPPADEVPHLPEPEPAVEVEVAPIEEVEAPIAEEAVPEEELAATEEPTAVPADEIAVSEEDTAVADEPAPWDPAFEAPEPEPEDAAPEEVNGVEKSAIHVNDSGVNGHYESTEPEKATREVNGTETPLVKMGREASFRSESLYPDSQSSDREVIAVPRVNGNVVPNKNTEIVTVTAVPEPESPKMSKKAKKRAKRMSISHPN